MGVPTVSLIGRTLLSRSALLISEAFGLSGLCPEDLDDFVACAARLAADRASLAAFRRDLRSDSLKGKHFRPRALIREAEAVFAEMASARQDARPCRF